jgi:hypothetical protein
MADTLSLQTHKRTIFVLSLSVLGLVAWATCWRNVRGPVATAARKGFPVLKVNALPFEAYAAQVATPAPVSALVEPLLPRTSTPRGSLSRASHSPVFVIPLAVRSPVRTAVFQNLITLLAVTLARCADVVLAPLYITSFLGESHLISARLLVFLLISQDLAFVFFIDPLALRFQMLTLLLPKTSATRAYFSPVLLVEILKANFAAAVETVTTITSVELTHRCEVLAPVAPLHPWLREFLSLLLRFALALSLGCYFGRVLIVNPLNRARVLTWATDPASETPRSSRGNGQFTPAALTWSYGILILSQAVYARFVEGLVRLVRGVQDLGRAASFYHHFGISEGVSYG